MPYGRGIAMIMVLHIRSDLMIEDIFKIGKQSYKRTKNMTVSEKVTYYNNFNMEADFGVY